MDIIPAIDIIDGKCVRLEKGDYSRKKVYSSDPVELARTFESWGVKRLHLIDLDGAREKKVINHKILSLITSSTNLIVDFGGGIRNDSDLRIAFENGAAMVTGGSIAVQDPDLFLKWLDNYGPDRIILGADHKNEMISVNAWSESSGSSIYEFLEKFINHGIKKIISTDINRDGMMEGPSIRTYKRILEIWPDLQLIASGGISSPDDILKLKKTGVSGVIIGKAIYENRITGKDLKPYFDWLK